MTVICLSIENLKKKKSKFVRPKIQKGGKSSQTRTDLRRKSEIYVDGGGSLLTAFIGAK